MNDENVHFNQDWIYEAILNFLNSPTWRIPVSEFTSNNCLVFAKKGEKRKEKMEVHKVLIKQNFVEIINKLLNDLYLEIGITKEQFDKTCKKSSKIPERKAKITSLTKLFDYDYFKNIMYRKNAEMKNKQANIMQKEVNKNNIPSGFYKIGNNPRQNKIKEVYSQLIPQNQGAEEFQIEEALRQSMEEENNQKGHFDEEQIQLEEVLKLSKLEYDNSRKAINNNNVEEGQAIGEESSVKNEVKPNEIIQNQDFNQNFAKIQFPKNVPSNYNNESNNLQMLDSFPRQNKIEYK